MALLPISGVTPVYQTPTAPTAAEEKETQAAQAQSGQTATAAEEPQTAPTEVSSTDQARSDKTSGTAVTSRDGADTGSSFRAAQSDGAEVAPRATAESVVTASVVREASATTESDEIAAARAAAEAYRVEARTASLLDRLTQPVETPTLAVDSAQTAEDESDPFADPADAA